MKNFKKCGDCLLDKLIKFQLQFVSIKNFYVKKINNYNLESKIVFWKRDFLRQMNPKLKFTDAYFMISFALKIAIAFYFQYLIP